MNKLTRREFIGAGIMGLVAGILALFLPKTKSIFDELAGGLYNRDKYLAPKTQEGTLADVINAAQPGDVIFKLPDCPFSVDIYVPECGKPQGKTTWYAYDGEGNLFEVDPEGLNFEAPVV